MQPKTTAVLLINLGSPDGPSTREVRRFLRAFLNDRRVIDLPFVLQKILVNLIIVPFRSPKSSKLYKMLWTEKGSPLISVSEQLSTALQAKLGARADVFMAMRYGNPLIVNALETIRKGGYARLVVMPMFPQYASSTSGTAIQAVLDRVGRWEVIPDIQVISQFYDHPAFIGAMAEKIKSYCPEKYDHILFSYHGLPNRHVAKSHPEVSSAHCHCEESMPVHGRFCYKAACYQTTRALVQLLEIEHDKYSVAFQSRISGDWISPFADKVLIDKAKEGRKSVLVVAPSFVADCLETTVEIGVIFKNIFVANGGDNLQLVDSLNVEPRWVAALDEMLTPYI